MSVLVVCDFDYADEFSIHGFKVYKSKEDFEEYLLSVEKIMEEKDIELRNKYIEKYKKEPDKYHRFCLLEISFGTNESLLLESFNEFKNAFYIKEITEEDEKVLDKYFNRYKREISFGTTCMFEVSE